MNKQESKTKQTNKKTLKFFSQTDTSKRIIKTASSRKVGNLSLLFQEVQRGQRQELLS
jgi:isopenicillin N synthase-like dioxygenase